MQKRRWLIGISLVVHVVIVLALFVAGFWKLDRLEFKRTFELAVAPPPPPPPAAGASALATTKFKLKQKKVVHDVVQPVQHLDEKPAATADVAGTGAGAGTGTGTGTGDEPGTCTEPPCGPGEAKEVEKPPVCDEPPLVVPPAVIKGMRISGETQIHPSDVDKVAIMRSGKDKVMATYKVCVGAKGEVASISAAAPSGYASWDSAIAAALRNWRYRPYQLTPAQYAPRDPRCPRPTGQLHAVAVCGMVTFIYAIQ